MKTEKLFEHIAMLEGALYTILETNSLDKAREIAADVLGEDIQVYDEVDELDVDELDFDSDTFKC